MNRLFTENPKLLVSGPAGSNYYHRVKFNRDSDNWNYVMYKYQNNKEILVGMGQVPAGLHDVMVIYTSHTKIDKAVSVLRAHFAYVLDSYITSVTVG